MSKIDNQLRTINQYLKDMFDIFGGQSKEYSRAYQQVQNTVPKEILESGYTRGNSWKGDIPDAPLQLSRSQKVMYNYGDSLGKLRDMQKRSGTAKEQREIYRRVFEAEGKEYTAKNVKEAAQKEKIMSDNIMLLYDDIMKSDYLTEDEKKDISDTLLTDYFRDDDLEGAYNKFLKYKEKIDLAKETTSKENQDNMKDKAVENIGGGISNLNELL